MKTPRRHSTREVAFTLVEVLVAEAVFLILLLLVMQLIFGALQATTAQKRRMDELGDARQSLDRLSLDWAGRVRRDDIYATFTNLPSSSSTSAANAQIGFLTQAQWYTPTGDTVPRHLAWVTYGINNITQVNQGSQTVTTPGLTRSLTGYDWSGTANAVLTLPMTNAPTTGTVTLDPLGSTVFCFGYSFLQQMPSASASYPNAFTTNSALTLTSTNLVGVAVAVASLDQQSRQLVNQAQLVAMANALLPIPDGQSPQTYWVSQINSGAFATAVKAAGVPASVANSVHVYQRILYVND